MWTNTTFCGQFKEGGVFLLNCMWKDGDLEKHLPASLRRTIARKKIRFYTLNAVDIAMNLGLGGLHQHAHAGRLSSSWPASSLSMTPSPT